MPALSPSELLEMFSIACKQYYEDHPQIISDQKHLISMLGDSKKISKQIKELEQRIREYDILLSANTLEETQSRMRKLSTQRIQAQKELAELRVKQRNSRCQKSKLKSALDTLTQQSFRAERFVRIVLDRAVVYKDKSIFFVFKDGYSCTVEYNSD